MAQVYFARTCGATNKAYCERFIQDNPVKRVKNIRLEKKLNASI